jgi:uncharacterized membrane protein
MKLFLYAWVVSLVLLLIIDSTWLITTSQKFYKVYLNHLFATDIKYVSAVIFYVLYALGIAYIIIIPSFGLNYSLTEVIAKGFVLGIVAYGAYDLTNQATLKDWPLIITIVDMIWGGVLTSLVSGLAYKLLKDFFMIKN